MRERVNAMPLVAINAMEKMVKNFKKGFSMAEVMLGVFILSIGLIGIITTIASSTKNSIDSRNQAIAAGLAQEGLELVRNVRDNNLAGGKPAFTGIDQKDYCRIGFTLFDCNGLPTENSDNGSTFRYPYTLRYDNSKYWYYTHLNGYLDSLSRFSRRIKVENYDNPPGNPIEGRKISSIVSWRENNTALPEPDAMSCNTANKCVFIQDILVDW